MARTTGGVIAIIALLVGMVWFGNHINPGSSPPSAGTLEERVAKQFGRYSTGRISGRIGCGQLSRRGCILRW